MQLSKGLTIFDVTAPSKVLIDETAAVLRCLWVARELPFPTNTGDRIYSAQLAQALARSRVDLTYLGLAASDPRDLPMGAGPTWSGVPGVKKSYWLALFSRYPLVAAAHSTSALRARLIALLSESWDVIILDHYSSAWALDLVKNSIRTQGRRTILGHVTHNHEEAIAKSLYHSYRGLLAKKFVLYLNYLKIRHWERRLTSEVDVVGAITSEDQRVFATQCGAAEVLVLTPGHTGRTAAVRAITSAVPRRVVLVGSYRWIVKQQNLRQLLLAADQPFANHGIALDIIGDVPDEIRTEFEGKLRATVFHGFVPDFQPFFSNARIALVPEWIGGGFKLKFLDYIFGGIPVATIAVASAGLPEGVRQHLLEAVQLSDLVDMVIANIDDLDRLNALQVGAFSAASDLFDWQDRGWLLRNAIAKHLSGAP